MEISYIFNKINAVILLAYNYHNKNHILSHFVIKIYVGCQEYQSEFVENKFKREKKKRIRRLLLILFLVVFFVAFGVVIFLKKVVNPIVLSYGEAQVNKMLVASSNNAINEIATINYDDLVDVSYSQNGEILSIKANTKEINRIGNTLALHTQAKIDETTTLGVNIPLGTLSGLAFLSGVGSEITFKVNPIGSAQCSFYTSFSSCGINQTSHKIFVTIESKASLILPFGIKVIENKNTYVASEFVIVGKVPNTYLNITSLDDLK